jgi:hypothetical protein
MTEQLMLGLSVEPTIAMHKGRAWIESCRGCGSLVAVSGAAFPDPRVPLEACPVCGLSNWHMVDLPVGPFSAKWAPLLVEFVQRLADRDDETGREAREHLEQAQVTMRESAVWTGSKHHEETT